MARWNHLDWRVAAHPLVDDAVLTVGFREEARKARTGKTYRGFRIDFGGDARVFGNAFVDGGRIAIRLDEPILGITRFDFAVDAEERAVEGTGRMMRGGAWEALPTLPG